MVNPLRWKILYQTALVSFVSAGAMAGVACGYRFSGWTWGGPVFWLKLHPDDAVGWATIGAIVVGIVIYGILAVSRPRRSHKLCEHHASEFEEPNSDAPNGRHETYFISSQKRTLGQRITAAGIARD